MKIIRTDEVLRATSILEGTLEGSALETAQKIKLDSLADQLKYGGASIEGCASGAEVDEIREALSHYGHDSFARYMYGD